MNLSCLAESWFVVCFGLACLKLLMNVQVTQAKCRFKFRLKVFFEAREPVFLIAAAVEGRPLKGMSAGTPRRCRNAVI